MRINRPRTSLLLPMFAAAIIGLTACGTSGSGSTDTTTAGTGSHTGSTGAATTISVSSTSKGQVLTDSSGRSLYVSDQEMGTVLCKSSACTAIWAPLTINKDTKPTAPGSVSGLGTLTRPDGKVQVALHGQPLYAFSFDHAAGDTGGDGQKDSFDGTNFTWHLAIPTGAAPAPSGTPSSSASSGGHGGGYGY